MTGPVDRTYARIDRKADPRGRNTACPHPRGAGRACTGGPPESATNAVRPHPKYRHRVGAWSRAAWVEVGCWFEDGRLESMTTACVYHRDRKRQTHPRRPGMSVVAGGGSSSAVRSTPVPAYRRPTTPYRLTPYRDPPVAVYRGAGVYGIIWVMTGLGGLNATMLNGASARWRAGVTRSRRRPEACGLLERALR